MSAESLPSLVDALVVLLVRLHLVDFYWGDVSLSNVLFRRSAGGFAAYLVDAETGELRPTLSRQMREPKVVELGHHRRELQALTGLDVEDAQARRLLNDMAAFVAHYDLGREDKGLAANRWLTQIFEPIMAMVPPDARGKLEPAEIFHEILVHRWYLSERAGAEVGIFDTARDYIDTVLSDKPDELVAAEEP